MVGLQVRDQLIGPESGTSLTKQPSEPVASQSGLDVCADASLDAHYTGELCG